MRAEIREIDIEAGKMLTGGGEKRCDVMGWGWVITGGLGGVCWGVIYRVSEILVLEVPKAIVSSCHIIQSDNGFFRAALKLDIPVWYGNLS